MSRSMHPEYLSAETQALSKYKKHEISTFHTTSMYITNHGYIITRIDTLTEKKSCIITRGCPSGQKTPEVHFEIIITNFLVAK
jgi:hypothetical protein